MLVFLPPRLRSFDPSLLGTIVEWRVLVRPPVSYQVTPLSGLRHNMLLLPPPSVTMKSAPSEARRKALVTGWAVKSVAGTGKEGRRRFQVAPLSSEVAMTKGWFSE